MTIRPTLFRGATNAGTEHSLAQREAWRVSEQRQAWIQKVRTFGEGDHVVIHGAKGVVGNVDGKSIDEKTLTVYVAVGKRIAPYHVQVVEHDVKK